VNLFRSIHRRRVVWPQWAVTLLLLLGLSGTHWWVLQSVAWSGMIVSYSAQSGLLKGVEETFDGEHPCKMCKAIEQAREHESSDPSALAPVQPGTDLRGLPPEAGVALTCAAFPPPPFSEAHAEALNSPPPLPPPRSSPA
jgi:hypothetical protein